MGWSSSGLVDALHIEETLSFTIDCRKHGWQKRWPHSVENVSFAHQKNSQDIRSTATTNLPWVKLTDRFPRVVLVHPL